MLREIFDHIPQFSLSKKNAACARSKSELNYNKNPAVLNIIESYFFASDFSWYLSNGPCKIKIKTNIYFQPITILDLKKTCQKKLEAQVRCVFFVSSHDNSVLVYIP